MRSAALRRAITVCVLPILALVSVACGPRDQHMYYWSSYQQDLYLAYRYPQRSGRFEATLLRIIETSDASGRKTPPGVLAEYGYFLYQRGEYERAIGYFEREARAWPESSALMQRVIERARKGSGS